MVDVVFREATLEDRDDILNIRRDVYDGLDYLPFHFDKFISSPNTTSYVAIVENRIVGYTAMTLVDDGVTAISRASRVSETVAGQGVYKRLYAHAIQETSANVVAFTADNGNKALDKPSFQKAHTLILTKPVDVFVLGNDCKPPGEDKLQIPMDDEIEKYFVSSTIRRYLFPMERIIVEWVPYRLLKSNIALFKGEGTRIYSDVEGSSDKTPRGLLSISATIPVQDPPYISYLNIYGMDVSTLYQHVAVHVKCAKEIAGRGNSIKFITYVAPGFDTDLLRKTCQDTGLSHFVWENKEKRIVTTQFLYEKDLRENKS